MKMLLSKKKKSKPILASYPNIGMGRRQLTAESIIKKTKTKTGTERTNR